MNILVVEDNRYEMNNIVRVLQSISKEFNIYKAYTGEECFNILDNINIDMFILDIQLPDISGIKIAEKIRNIPKYELTYMIFITTHTQLQLDAFKKVHCYDFIEKPYKKEELIQIIKRLEKGISAQKQQGEQNRKSITFQMKDFTIKLYTDEILFIESDRRNCIVHTENREYLIRNITIKKIIELLPMKNFMQTHKSYIINLSNIYKIEKSEKNSWIVHFREYTLVAYVSNSYKEKFLANIES